MFNILAQYAIVEMLDAEAKTYRSKQQDVSDKQTNVHENEKRGLMETELNVLKQLDEHLKEMKKLRDELDKLEHDIKRLGSV
jgi:hypothetical protein